MIVKRLIYLITLVGMVIFYIFYQRWLSWLLLMAVVFLPWFSLAISLPGLYGTQVTLSHPATVPMGEQARAALGCTSKLPPLPLRGKLRITRATTGESWLHKTHADLPTEHCGQLTIQPVKCRLYDYLGLFRFRAKRLQPGSTVVRPHPVALENPPDLSRYLARSWRPKRGGGFGENHELRLYRPGDNLQQIHWKLTAKTGKLILRETVEPEDGLVLLKLDLAGSPSQLDEALGKLLWLSTYLLEQGISHEIQALTGEGVVTHPVRENRDTLDALDLLLGCKCCESGSIRDQFCPAVWEYYIGGGQDEA